MNSVTITQADLLCEADQRAVLEMMNAYAMDQMGDGKPLSDEVRRTLIPGLQQFPTTLIFLAFVGDEPVGIALCFRGFSTFAARPLINISDFHVLPAYRGQGIGRLLLAAVERKARAEGCCRITLEVQEHNARARHVYAAAGFAQAVHVEAAGGALFLSKPL